MRLDYRGAHRGDERIAAASLARPEATSIGFVGAGIQAHSHLAALRRVLPRLARVVAYSRTAASAEASPWRRARRARGDDDTRAARRGRRPGRRRHQRAGRARAPPLP